mgnify:CR=1 FL=1
MFKNEWWCNQRKLKDVKLLLKKSSLIIALIDQDKNRLAAFCRVLTDQMYKALILDVIVQKDYRGKGLANRLFAEINNASELSNVKHFELYCLPDKENFYKKFGFTSDLNNFVFMRSTELLV